MLSSFVAPLRRTIEALVSSDSPRQLAAGFTLGMVVGLLPKGNLIAISLCVLVFSLRVNRGLALVAAVLFSALGTAMDPFAHKLGLIVLGYEPMQACYAAIYNMPLGPWLGFNNTVVMGLLCIGSYIAYPTYWASRTRSERLQPRAKALVHRYRLAGFVIDADTEIEPRQAA
jgi:uncharacterized protein (TIGR03546 family)